MASDEGYRIEHDSMGEVPVPGWALWGASTQRAVENFPISGRPLPPALIHALGHIKAACATAAAELGALDTPRAEAIIAAARRVAAGEFDDHFPVDVFQTGSGTSSNMNANEVIARVAGEASGLTIHPNDHVNVGQSSNDVFPSAVQVAAALTIGEELEPALAHLAAALEARAAELDDTVKTGRTHLMDAMPVTLGQELTTWARQMETARQRLAESAPRLADLPLGGTAVGTGVNAPAGFGTRTAAALSAETGHAFTAQAHPFVGISAPDVAAEVSGQMKAAATGLMKITSDLRWMNSGPLAGLAEITLPALQPGSSIMPGKVNPVIPEAAAQVCAQVIGNDAAVTTAVQSGNFQLNVMLPLIGRNLVESASLLAGACNALADKAVAGFHVNRQNLAQALARNPVLVTALNPVIGYEKGALIAKRAQAEGRTVLEIAREETDLEEAELRRLLDPVGLTGHDPDQPPV
ncbi:class II fumarate hydratase [Thiohalospira sp.]|uniref:class II fumarate hydratase n=1 Tax=Thiohalospira sp. TaxID=3080549 RepID=UPI00397F72B1